MALRWGELRELKGQKEGGASFNKGAGPGEGGGRPAAGASGPGEFGAMLRKCGCESKAARHCHQQQGVPKQH